MSGGYTSEDGDERARRARLGGMSAEDEEAAAERVLQAATRRQAEARPVASESKKGKRKAVTK